MAVDKRGRKLPKGIRQRYNDFEGRFMYQGERYLVHGVDQHIIICHFQKNK